MKRIWKIIIALVVLGVGTLLILYYAIDWGNYESHVEKTELTSTNDSLQSGADTTASLDLLEGLYKGNSENGKSELIFDVDGLKQTKGTFGKFVIDFEIRDDYTTSVLEVVIETNSINTENEYRDEHLMEDGFFEVVKFPNITYRADGIVLGDTSYTAQGELTLMGKTADLNFNFKHLGGGTYDSGEAFEAFEGNFKFDRVEYGMEEDSSVGNEVTITFYCELTKS